MDFSKVLHVFGLKINENPSPWLPFVKLQLSGCCTDCWLDFANNGSVENIPLLSVYILITLFDIC